MTDQKIYYKKVRDLGGIFGATFGYIKQNFKPLYGSLLFFAGPFLLVAATVSAYMLGSSLNMTKLFGSRMSSLTGDLFGAYLLSMLFMFIGVNVYNVILNRNVIENEKLLAGEEMTVKHGVINFWSDFWRILGNTLLLGVVMVISIAVLVLIFAGIFTLAGGDKGSGTAIALAVIGVLLLLVAMLIFGPILSFVPMAALFVCQRDEINIFQALAKVFHYMRNNFWSTWVVSMVGLLAYMVMGMVAQIPVFIITMLTTFTRMKSTVGYGMEDQSTPVLLIIVTAVSSLLSYAVMVVYHLISIYQYTNLEEKKEGQSIIDKINQIQ